MKSSDPCLVFNSRQREGEFLKQGCGDKGTTSLSSTSGPCGTNVSLSLFQAEILSSATLLKVFRTLGTVFLDPPKRELLFNGQELELLGWP